MVVWAGRTIKIFRARQVDTMHPFSLLLQACPILIFLMLHLAHCHQVVWAGPMLHKAQIMDQTMEEDSTNVFPQLLVGCPLDSFPMSHQAIKHKKVDLTMFFQTLLPSNIQFLAMIPVLCHRKAHSLLGLKCPHLGTSLLPKMLCGKTLKPKRPATQAAF